MTSLKGNLNSVDLANIFQMLSLNQREGTLYIFEGASRKAIYFGHDGVSMLSKGKSKSDSLGRILQRRDRVTPEELESALQRREGSGRLLGQVLVEDAVCTRADIEEALQIQIEEEVYSLFIWKDAQFEFVEGDPDEEFLSEGVQKLTFNVNSLIMEAAKRVDEWEWIQSVVPDPQEVYRYTGQNVDLTEAVFQESFSGKVLAAIDGKRSVDEIIEASYVNRFEVSKILAILVEGSAIEKLPVADLTREAETAVAAGDTDAAVKFLSRLVAVKGDTPQMHKQLAQAFEGDRELEKAAFHYRVYAEILADQKDVKAAFLVYKRICDFLPTDLAAADRMIEVFAINPDGLEEHANDIIGRGKQLAEIYVELRRSSRAIQVLHRVVSLGPDDPDLRNRLISVYLASGMPGEAITEYEALADTAISVKDLETAEKIYRKILTIDRGREEVVSRLNQILSKKKRRQQNVKHLIVAGVLLAAAGAGSWFGIGWYNERSDQHARRELDGQARLAAIRVKAGPVQEELTALLKEFATRPADHLLLAKSLRELQPRIQSVDTSANAVLMLLTELRSEFQGARSDENAVDLVNQISANLITLKKRVNETQKTLRESAESALEQAHEMVRDCNPTRDVLAKLDFATRVAADCPGFPTSEKGIEGSLFKSQVEQCLVRFDETKKLRDQKLEMNDVDGAYETVCAYLTDKDYPPADLREEMLLPVRILSKPPGARVVTRDGRDTGQLSGPACVVLISVPKGESFDLELPGFSKAALDIAPVKDVDPAIVAAKVKHNYEVVLEKAQAFRKGTSDGRPVTAAPMVSRNYIVVPSSRSCDVIGRTKNQIVGTLHMATERGSRAGGVILDRDDDVTAVLPGDGVLLMFDVATGKPRGSWNGTRGAIQFDLVLSGENVLAADDHGHLHLVSIAKRQSIWEYPALSASGEPVSFSTAPVVAGDEVWIGCENGVVHVVDLRTGNSIRKIMPPAAEPGRVTAPVVVSQGSAYFLNRDVSKQTRVTRWNIAVGRADWSEVVAGDVRSSAMLHEDSVFLVSAAADVYGLRAADGHQTHGDLADKSVKVRGEPVMDGSVIYVGCDNGVLYALDVRGQHIDPVWKFPIRTASGKPVPVTTRCVLAGGLILFGAEDNAVYALERGN